MAGISPVNTLVFNPADYINTSATTQAKTGGLILGTDPGGSELLRVGGVVSVKNGTAVGAQTAINIVGPTSGGQQYRDIIFNQTGGLYGSKIRAGSNYDATLGNSLEFITADGAGVSATRVAINTTGSVIIGADPGGSEVLRVGGDARINGVLQAAGAASIRGQPPASSSVLGLSFGLMTTLRTNATDCYIYAENSGILGLAGDLIMQPRTDIGCSFRVVTGTPTPSVRLTVSPSGNVILGADPGGSELLRCTGGFRFTADSILTSTTDAASTTSAALVISGGAGIGKRSFLGTIGSTFKGNVVAGVQDGTAAVSGQSGEVLSSTVAGVAAAATGVAGNVTSLALSPGDWLISAHATISGGATGLTSGSQQKLSVVTTSATDGTEGDTMQINTILALSANGKHALSIPQLRVNISSTTTIYLTSSVAYAAGSPTAAAKLIATRMR